MLNTPTPHINSVVSDLAKTVLMPGDPLRAKFISENFLVDAKLANNVRGIQGYTGYYNGTQVSVMASGIMAVEMEAAALYMNAACSGKNALAICTIPDSLVTGESLSAEERETGFNKMVDLALKTAISL